MTMPEKIELPTYETLLVEAIKSLTVDSGIVSSPVPAANNTLSDSTKNWPNGIHKNRLVKIVRGDGAGQIAVIDDNSGKALIIKGTWPRAIAVGAVYIILNADFMQMLRDVLNAGYDISATHPLETHDPTIEDVEDKLDHPSYGLAALKALIDSLAGGAFYGSYGPRNVEVDNDVDFGTILYDPAGNIITAGEITPGTYTIRRVRGAVDTEIVAAAASSEAAGRVYITYNFPAASWNVGDIFYITFTGIQVTLNGVITEYPNLYVWGRVVREADISAKIDTVDAIVDDISANLAAVINNYLGHGTHGLSPIRSAITNLDAVADDTLANVVAIINNYVGHGTHGLSPIRSALTTIDAIVDDISANLAAVINNYLNHAIFGLSGIHTDLETVDGIVGNILLDTQIRKVPSGSSGAIGTGASKYIEIDSGTSSAEILAIIINGVVGFDWTLAVYVPVADAVNAPAAADKRDSISYLNTDAEGGLLKPFAVAYNAFLKFTNDNVGDQTIIDVVVVYRSRGTITIGAWT